MFTKLKKNIASLFKMGGKLNYRLVPLRISLIYFFISFLWILLSDRLLEILIKEHDSLIIISTYKGWLYVAVIAVVLYTLLDRAFKKVEETEKKLAESYEELAAAHEELTASEEELKQQFDELKAYTDYIRISEDRLKRAQKIANVGNWELDLNSNTIWASEEFFMLYGISYQTSFLTLAQILDTIHPDDRMKMNMALKGLIEERKAYNEEYRIIRADDKTERIIHSVAELETDNSGNPCKVLGVIRDITEEKRAKILLEKAKERADSANRAKSMFLANMSHEIRTPMNGILGMIQLAQMADSKGESEECLQLARKSADSLLRIIDDILDYSKIEVGKMPIEKSEFNVREVINDVLTLFGVAAKQKNITMINTIEQEIPCSLMGDAVRLRQILSNLVGNAVKFTGSGTVSVSALVEESSEKVMSLKFIVEDTGIGIPKENMEHIFESFNQLDSSYTKRFGGTGLGLAISKALVKAMGGSIGADSIEGKGSRFYFTIPFERINKSNYPGNNRIYGTCSLQRERYKNIRVLLAEDEKINQMIISKYLGRFGMHVEIADNGLEAICKFKDGCFDAVIMDVQMPEMDGITAASIIRSIEKDSPKHTPIIALTAYAMSSDKQNCLKAGMDDFLPKPVELEQLLKTLERLM
ncbi:MAG: ATP-binding protein [Clostridia bacterium]|nr:ATP-binding protein [Clostridia bacterium]